MTKRLRKPSGRIAMLPESVRTEINKKLRKGWRYPTIIRWLFAQKATEEIPDLDLKEGDSYSLAWRRNCKNAEAAQRQCKKALSIWFNTYYREWLREEAHEDSSIRLLKGMHELCSVASETAQPEDAAGGNMLIQSMLLDTIKLLHEDKKDPAELAQLANAWARLNQTVNENEKIKLRTQASLDAGLEALKAEITKDPETVELFKKLHDIVKGSRKPTA
jgi:hypothetical protein